MADTVRAHLDQAGEEIVAGNPFRALGHINSALALTERLEILIRQMIADDRKRGGRLYGGIWHDDPLKLEAWALVEDPQESSDG